MSRLTKLLVTGTLALAAIAPVASARPVFAVRGGFYGPGWYGWYGPGWGPYYGYYGYGYAPNAGTVKIDTKLKDTAVYVDGGYAGTVGQLKTFHLRPGEHNIDLRDPDGHSFYQEKVTVLVGKTLTIHP